MTDAIYYFLPIIDQLGLWCYIVVLLLCFLETLAFIGTILPGGLMIIFIGFLAAWSPLNIWVLVLFAALGAIIGDSFSYWLGTKGTCWFKNENVLLKISHLEKAQVYFNKHGDKSIFLGRFIGVIRPIIPFVAGLSKMNIKVFLFCSIVGGFLWSASHLWFGYFLGNSVEELQAAKKTEILFVLIPIFIVIIWVVIERRNKTVKLIEKDNIE